MSRINAAIASILVATALGTSAEATPIVADGVASISLCGTLLKERHWGPPNFGEDPRHDSKFDAWFVVLKKIVKVQYGSEQSSLRKIQIMPRPEVPIGTNTKRRLYEVTGTLDTAVAPAEVMQVTLWWKTLREVKHCP
ncbi:hypothetical protein [Rhodoferax sp. GW822-FHT02A01]|uniref:hypothetical protein n=1 Tax=Rhodoferax sp. GW822-FHT02A01 TaxID=3141537 RepID=UPI00315D229B